jgi:hypothetical protein
MNYTEAVRDWRADRARFERLGIHPLPSVQSYRPEEWSHDFALAMDAQPQLLGDPTSALPAILTSSIDPNVFRVLFSPNKAVEVLGEEKRGTWDDDVVYFPMVEPTGEVSSYGDYNNNGRAGINPTWPARQQYIFQVIKEYGEREMSRAALAKINLASEIDNAAAQVMNKFLNFSYIFGIQGLQAYGIANDPSLGAALTPSTKTAGGTAWINTATGLPVATANEVYADIQALFYQLMKQTNGLIDQDSRLLVVLSTNAQVGLTITNSFNVNVNDLLKKNFPNITIVTLPQYNVTSAINNQGIAAGNFIQMWALDIEGQQTGFAAYSEKYREHPLIRHMSSYRQKVSGGTWGAIIRMPVAVASMVGI